ncbi:MAG: hypothetical protein CMJ64_04375 [Planctomycetaceae bacterium]|nr:hypothetical protein [Planctomycetaceae bacterium]
MPTLLLTTLLLLGIEQHPDVLVVCPQEFRAALQPWVAHRVEQGYRVAFVSSEQSADEIRDDARRAATMAELKSVVLVGDWDPRAFADERLRARCTPAVAVKAKVNVLWGSEPEIATDNWYVDLDDDQLPDVPIGRLSVDTPQQLVTIVDKILRYERERKPGTWRRRLNFVAGVGGFGALADSVLETATKKFLTELIPPAYEISMTYGSWRSPYCPDPRQFHTATLDRLNEGSLFWVYIGHGQRRFLDRVRTPSGFHHIFDTDDVRKLHLAGGAPIAVFLACYTGSFDEVRDCLGEELVRSEQGPVAAFCGSRITMPYAMAVMGNELMDQYFVQKRATLGEAVLHAKRQMARTLTTEEQAANPNRHLLDALAAAISPAKDMLDEERLEHVQLFNLLGDPLLRLNHAQDLEVVLAKDIEAGQELRIGGTSPIDGNCTVELVCRRDRTKRRTIQRQRYDPRDDALAAYDDTYANANDRVWTTQTIAITSGEFETTLPVPAEARGASYVRVFVESPTEHALGAAKVFVRQPK